MRFTDRSLKGMKPPPKPQQFDYFDDNVPGFGRRKAHLITRTELRAELNKIKSRPAPVEANRTFEVIRRLFNWAIEEEIVAETPAANLSKPAEESPRERSLTADELQTLWLA